MILWFCDSVILWFCDYVILWFCDSVIILVAFLPRNHTENKKTLPFCICGMICGIGIVGKMRNTSMCCDTRKLIVIVHTYYNTNPPPPPDLKCSSSPHAVSVSVPQIDLSARTDKKMFILTWRNLIILTSPTQINLWFCDSVILWFCDSVILWFCDNPRSFST